VPVVVGIIWEICGIPKPHGRLGRDVWTVGAAPTDFCTWSGRAVEPGSGRHAGCEYGDRGGNIVGTKPEGLFILCMSF